MPTLDQVKVSLDTRLQDNWLLTPISFDNDSGYSKGSVPWIRSLLTPVLSENADLNGAMLHYGIYRINVFTPIDSGTNDAYSYGQQLMDLFSNTDFDGITCYASELRRNGDDGNGWYMMTVLVNFWAQQ